MIGEFRNGCNKAHKYCEQHDSVFNCRMIGTFNIKVKGLNLNNYKPVFNNDNARYWLVAIEGYRGWAIRNHTSKLPLDRLEILTKNLLPEHLKRPNVNIEILERWDSVKIKNWATTNYQFQTFEWNPKLKADSKMIWSMLKDLDWSGKTVLDIGSHYGYYSFQVSKAGAAVVAYEPDNMPRNNGILIRDKIEMCDVQFTDQEPDAGFDIVLYMSVHHQPDPNYFTLARKLEELKTKANEKLIVELIMPPMFGRDMSEEQIDEIVGGKVLIKYKHKVRGIRKVYEVKI